MTVIEIKPHRWGWKVLEADGFAPARASTTLPTLAEWANNPKREVRDAENQRAVTLGRLTRQPVCQYVGLLNRRRLC